MVDDSQSAISAAASLAADTLPLELDGDESGEEDAETLGALSILTQLLMLLTAFLLGHIARRRQIHYLHGAGLALLIGAVVSCPIRLLNRTAQFREWLDFKEQFFLLFLIPPIIFESGFAMKPKPFFSNFGAICTFAFLGTIISTVAVGLMVFFAGKLGLCFELQVVSSLLFGSLISATDPVTVLAIFQEVGTDINLYSLVFGESVMNDAVAIVLYRSVLHFQNQPITLQSTAIVFGLFLLIFIGSFAIGTLVALASAILFKYAGFKGDGSEQCVALECCIVVIFPYCAYMLAESLHLSGIVAILFCGIVMAHYTRRNLSKAAHHNLLSFFKILASLAETFVFIYMGVAMFLEEQAWSHVGLTVVTIISMLVARLLNVYPLAGLVNLFRPSDRTIPRTHQFMLWFSGLRGAIAFALALMSTHDLPAAEGRALLTTTLFIVLFTVLAVGGSTTAMIDTLHLRGSRYEDAEFEFPLASGPSDKEKGDEEASMLSLESEDDDVGLATGSTVGAIAGGAGKGKRRSRRDPRKLKHENSFQSIDTKYLRPFFTVEVPSEIASGEQTGANVDSRGRGSESGDDLIDSQHGL